MQTSDNSDNWLGLLPVMEIVFKPQLFAVFAAKTILRELPEVESPQKTSPGQPYPYTCWANTRSGEISFAIAVIRELCSVRVIAGKACCK